MTHDARRLPAAARPAGRVHWSATEPAALAEAAPRGWAGAAAGDAQGWPADGLPVGVPRLMRKLLTAHTAREREQHVWAALRACGFDWCEIVTLAATPAGLQPLSFVGTYANTAWAQRWFAACHHEVDPRLAEAAPSGLPLVWDSAWLAERVAQAADPAPLQRLLDDLHACGIRSGVSFNLPGPAGPGQRTVVALSAGTAGSGWIVDSLLSHALTFALSMHEFHLRYTRLPPAPPCAAAVSAEPSRAQLTAVQQEILRTVERGLSDKEIAARLGISTYAVDYHMRQLRRQFGVRNRVQLAGLLMPDRAG